MKLLMSFAITLLLISLIGCDHSTNAELAPSTSSFAIVSPTNNALVNGAVNISVNTNGIAPSSIEFYINGNLFAKVTSPPWQCTWNVAGHTSQSLYTIKAIAFNNANSFSTTPDVFVRIK